MDRKYSNILKYWSAHKFNLPSTSDDSFKSPKLFKTSFFIPNFIIENANYCFSMLAIVNFFFNKTFPHMVI
jgi:hypothetical protein